MKINYYKSESADPYYNLAMEEFLFQSKKAGDVVIYLWQNGRTVVIGRYQNVFEEVNLDIARGNHIKIVRRDTGGGAVYHDLGNLNYSFIVDLDSDDLLSCQGILYNLLEQYGICISHQGRNDISVGEYKISGTARHIGQGKILHHGTLLVNSNLNMLESVLTRNTKIVDTVSTQSKKRRVANLYDFLTVKPDVNDIVNAFEDSIRQSECSFEILENNSLIHKLIEEKYKTDSWNYGFNPGFEYRNTGRFSGGTLILNLIVKNGVIKTIKFEGDFFARKDISILEHLLEGACLNNSITEVIKDVDAEAYFAGISNEEILFLFKDLILRDSENTKG